MKKDVKLILNEIKKLEKKLRKTKEIKKVKTKNESVKKTSAFYSVLAKSLIDSIENSFEFDYDDVFESNSVPREILRKMDKMLKPFLGSTIVLDADAEYTLLDELETVVDIEGDYDGYYFTLRSAKDAISLLRTFAEVNDIDVELSSDVKEICDELEMITDVQ